MILTLPLDEVHWHCYVPNLTFSISVLRCLILPLRPHCFSFRVKSTREKEPRRGSMTLLMPNSRNIPVRSTVQCHHRNVFPQGPRCLPSFGIFAPPPLPSPVEQLRRCCAVYTSKFFMRKSKQTSFQLTIPRKANSS